MSGRSDAASDFGGYVEATCSLLLTAVYQCKSCRFHAVFYKDLTRHYKSAHPGRCSDAVAIGKKSGSKALGGSALVQDESKPSQDDRPDSKKQSINETIQSILNLKEFQKSDIVKGLVGTDVNLRVFFETENDVRCDSRNDDTKSLANALSVILQMLMLRTKNVSQTKSEQRSHDESSNVSQSQKNMGLESIRQSKQIQTKCATSRISSTSSEKIDITSKGLMDMAAPVDASLDQMQGALDVNYVSSKDHDYENVRLEVKREELGNLSEFQNIYVKSLVPEPLPPTSIKIEEQPQQSTSTAQSNALTGSTAPPTNEEKQNASQESGTKEAGKSSSSNPLPLVTLESSKLYGNVDFQEIAQRASRTNPEATTITVVQHTGGNRPPTTIHFKKSYKSSAIIPTGESLGIQSPFLRREYGGSKIFACKECHSRYKTQNELERHTTKKHRKKKSFLCEICGDGLSSRSGMKVHIARKHGGESMLKCDVCDYVTRSEVRLAIHLKKHTKDASEFFCKPCNKSFVTESKLLQHRNSPVHKNAVDPIICEHCGYVTKKRDNFLVHLRKHTGEKPHKCRHCDYAAADGSTLKRHVMARHSAIRPFRCPHCPFSCVDKKGLTLHMRKHTGERPYTCDLCPYTAKRMGALTIHRRTHFRSKATDEAGEGATEVASYVDIPDVPSTQAQGPFTPAGGPATPYPVQLHSQAVVESVVSIATDGHLIPSAQASGVDVQIPADSMVAQETDQSVQAMWQSMS